MSTPAFRRMGDFGTRRYLVPLIENAIRECYFDQEFTVVFRGYEATRAPDGWFHPSTHPEMDERALYHYLAEPDRWVEEPFEYGPRMSVLIGSGMHDVVQHVMYRMGLLSRPQGTCLCCDKPHGTGKDQCPEWGVRDDRLGRRGHLDGLMTLEGWGTSGEGVFDLKTCTPSVIRDVQDNDLELFRRRWPKYYGQQQEYMCLTGKHQSMVLFMGISEGWPMREFTIPRNEVYINRLEAKYRAVRNYVQQGTVPPVACCSGGAAARRCPATACPIKTGAAS